MKDTHAGASLSEPAAAASIPVAIGDLLITFRFSDAPCRGRASALGWQRMAAAAEWQLWAQGVGEEWRGYPLTTWSVPPWRLWLLGELYSTLPGAVSPREMLRQTIAPGSGGAPLNGHFLLLGWNEETRCWHAWTDRFGTFHAYYSNHGRSAALGSFFPAVASVASRRALDWPALTGFFAFGFFPQDRTHLENVRILRPASHYLFDECGRLLGQERYWDWWHRPDRQRSYDDTVAEFGRVLRATLADHTSNGRIALPISGGLDSRSTVAALTDPVGGQGVNPRLWSYSYGYSEDSVETRIARRVASARGLPFQAFTIEPYLFDRLELVLSGVEGFQDVTQCRQAAVWEAIASHADYLIAAHWGDVWLDDMGLTGDGEQPIDQEALLSHALHKMEKGGRGWLLEQLCRPRLGREEPQTLLRDMVRQEMARVQQIEDPDFRVKAFKTDQWSFRWTTASLRMFQPAAFPRLPFYDTRMADFFCTVPSSFLQGRRLQIDYLKRFAPDLARITWQAYDADLFHYQHFRSWLLPRRALKKAGRLLATKRSPERNWEVQFLSPAGRQRLHHWLLRPGLRLHDFVSPAALAALLEAFYAAPTEQKRGYTVSMLLTFSAWLERYG